MIKTAWMWGPNLLRGEVRCKGNSKFSKHNKLWAKFFSFLKKSNRNRHLIGGLLVGLCALSPWAAIYRGTGTSPCPEEQQGAVYIRTLTYPLYLPGVMASLACSFRNSAMSCETDFVSIAISLCASGAVYGFISLWVYAKVWLQLWRWKDTVNSRIVKYLL